MRLDTDSVTFNTALQEHEVTSSEASADFQEILASGIAAAQSGDRVSARRLLFQASGIDPHCEDIWMWLASISEYPEELLIFLGNALDINPHNERALEWRASTRSLLAKTFVQRAAAAHQEGQVPRAQQCIEQALVFDEQCALAWLWKASLAIEEDQKVQFLEKVLEIDPENVDAKTALDSILTERSMSAFDDVRSAAAAGRRKKALELVDEFLRSEPGIADAWILRSHLSLGLSEKIESLQRALEIEPDNTTARSAYDFLVATVGDKQDTNAEGPRADTLGFVPHGEEENSCSQESEEPPSFIEKPLDAVFDSEEPPHEDFVIHVCPSDDTPGDQVVMETQHSQPEPIFCEPAADFDDVADSFENTLLETFDSDNQFDDAEPSHAHQTHAEFELEELQPLDLQENNAPPNSFDGSNDEPEYVEARPSEEVAEAQVAPPDESETWHHPNPARCPYCEKPNDPHAFTCGSCNAALSLSDIDTLLNNTHADRETIRIAVTQMEAEWNLRDFSETELTELAIGCLNLGEYESGINYLREASRLDPNNVILSGQLNAIAIRLDEIRRQNEVHGAVPQSRKILVVDDSPTVRKLIASKLEKSGHEVICAVDGVEALEQLENGLPDLILLDISMPRMDGYEVCKQIRTNPAARDLPVIMISGKDGFFDKVRGRMAGSTGYVTKPFGPETLMKALETYLIPEEMIAD